MNNRIIGPDDPPAFHLINEQAKVKNILICVDHASNYIVNEKALLGLSPTECERHIAYDIGAKEVAIHIANHLGVMAIIANYSRLMIDLNRSSDDPTSIREIYDGALVPGNLHISEAERQQRKLEIFDPYHEKLSSLIEDRMVHYPLIISIHSFTPQINGQERPWQIGLLSGHDRRASDIALKFLQTNYPHLTIGDNQPYSGLDGYDYTMSHHVFSRGLPSLLIELRQDEVTDEKGQSRYADYLTNCIKAIIATPNLNEIKTT